MTQTPLIQIKHLYKIFGPKPKQQLELVKSDTSKSDILKTTGHTVGLKNTNLDVFRGEIFVIMGLSGSGKSTLIRHFNRLIEPTDGQVVVNGKEITALDQKSLREFRRHTMSMVFQHFGLLPHYTVIENVAFGLKTRGIKKVDRLAKAKHWLVDVGLEGYEHQYPNQLSGGQQQRVGLARALCTNADILLMDEAFSALDPLIRSEMQDQLINLQSRLKKTIVFITHDLDEALRMGDRIAILNEGELVQVGKPADILLKPANDYVEKFVRDVNRARALTVETVMQPATHRIHAKTIDEALEQMRGARFDYAYYFNDSGFQGAISESRLAELAQQDGTQPLTVAHSEVAPCTSIHSVIADVIPETLNHTIPLPVLDDEGLLSGQISKQDLAKVLSN